MRNRKISAAMVLLAAVMMVFGGPVRHAAAAEEVVIGVSLSTLTNAFFVGMKMGIEDAARENNVKLAETNADGDIPKQASQIEDLIQQNVKGLIVNPVDSDAIVASQQKIIAAGIPLIYCDRGASSDGYTAFIATDNAAMGALAADKVAEFLTAKYGSPKGNVVEIQGLIGTSAARDRGEGFNARLESKYPDIKVAARQPGDFNQETSLNVMQNIIQANPEIDAVYGHNDDCILGAMKAIEGAGLLKKTGEAGHIYIIGIDGSSDAIDAIKAGNVDVTISQDPIGMGKAAVQLVLDAVAGKSVEKDIAQPFYVVDPGNVDAPTHWGNAAR
jgi:ribose transport system substrate-binding protein